MSDFSLLITSGDGPGECQQAVAHALARMQQDAAERGLAISAKGHPTKAGLRSAVVVLHGAGARGFAAGWMGTIQWRARSSLRPGHKRANWFIGVFALPPAPHAGQDIHARDVVFESFRAGGPGGQHQNTTDSAIRATHRLSGLCVTVRDERSQHRNKALALQRLALLRATQINALEAEQSARQNHLHRQLERGNPVRVFKGGAFSEVVAS